MYINNIKEEANSGLGGNGDFYVEMDIIPYYISKYFISMQIRYESYFGQAHARRFERNVNYLIAENRELELNDIFDNTHVDVLYNYCRDNVIKEFSELADVHGVSGRDLKIGISDISHYTSEIKNWSFRADSALINYGDEAFGGYGRCECDCHVPYALLGKISRQAFPR